MVRMCTKNLKIGIWAPYTQRQQDFKGRLTKKGLFIWRNTLIIIVIMGRDNTSKAMLLHTVSFYFRGILPLPRKHSFGLTVQNNKQPYVRLWVMPIPENNGSINCMLSIYGNNRTIICPQLSQSQRGRIWDEIGDHFGNTFFKVQSVKNDHFGGL